MLPFSSDSSADDPDEPVGAHGLLFTFSADSSADGDAGNVSFVAFFFGADFARFFGSVGASAARLFGAVAPVIGLSSPADFAASTVSLVFSAFFVGDPRSCGCSVNRAFFNNASILEELIPVLVQL